MLAHCVYAATSLCWHYAKCFIVMRLDKFLKVSRLIKRRTVANAVASAGHIWVNGKLAKPAYVLRVGDELLIQLGEQRQLHVRILIIPTTKSVPPDLAPTLYETLNEDGAVTE
jgi:ribosomal 50S subunit-recycling heat shock protein